MTRIIHSAGIGPDLSRRGVYTFLIALLLSLIVGGNAYAGVTVKGKIVNNASEPLIGATITVTGQKGGTVSDMDGNFSIDLGGAKLPCTLVVQYMGYKPERVTLFNMRDTHDKVIVLTEDNYSLNDVIVVGYGKSSRKKLTGAVAKVTSSVIAQATQESPIMALQGNATGVYVTQGSGVPGSGSSSIVIRGKSTLSSQTEPLYIIDGVPFNATGENPVGYTSTGVLGLPDALSFINPADIESIEVLKDAEATAIYGTRGANGVILVTTKKGQSGRIKVNANFTTTASYVSKRLDFLDTEDYLALRQKAFDTDLANGYVTMEDYTPNRYPDLLLWGKNDNYDWQDALMGKTSLGYDAQLTVSGGSKNTFFLVGGSYYTSNTVLISDDQYSRWSARANINHHSDDGRFNLEAGATFSGIKMDAYGSGAPYSYLNTAPNTPIYDELGRPYYIPDDRDYSSPSSFLAYEGSNETAALLGNVAMSYKFLNHFTAKVSMGYNYNSSNQLLQYKRYYYNPYDPSYYNQAMYYNMTNKTFVVEPQLTYDTSLWKGRLTFLIGGTYQSAASKILRIRGQDYPSDVFLSNVSSASTVIQYMNPTTQTKTASVFARLTYDWDSKYLLNAIFRRDGSSRFGPNHRFGNFYSVGVGWLFSNEYFVKDRIGDVLSHGKVRFSYGRTGNDGIGDYAYMTKYSTSSYPYEGNIGLYPYNLANEDLHWETTNKMDVGLELGFCNDRVLLTATWFRNRSFDLLTREYLPTQTGFSYITSNLDAVIDNKGWEFELNLQNIKTSRFRWNTSFNLTVPRNELVEYEGLESSGYYNTYEIGKSVNVVRGYNYLGVDKETGLPMFEDVNGDGKYTSAGDYKSLGTRDPQFYGGLKNTLAYKNFTLDFSFYFRQKKMEYGYLWRYMYPIGMQYNVTKEMAANYWTTPGQDAKYPGLTTTSSSPMYTYYRMYLSYSQAAYSSGSYLRLTDVTFSYDFPQRWLTPLHLSALRMYVQGKNLFTITGYDSYDPETGDVSVPSLTSFIVGLNVTF